MYLYAMFFKKDDLSRGWFSLKDEYLEPVKQIFPNYQDLNDDIIKGCIGFIKGASNKREKCVLLKPRNVIATDDILRFDYDVGKEMDIISGSIDKSLYRLARQSDWIDQERPFYPILCIMGKNDFDTVRKGIPDTIKVSSHTERIEGLKAKNDWLGIASIYEPLEKAHEKADLWNNPNDLYDLAFACSKLGEPKNGMEKDRTYLDKIKRYREFSILFYKRCCELEPSKSRYPSSLAYRYYLNAYELTKQKGRRDGRAGEEIIKAIKWLDKALAIYPNSIKDNYRKGKLIFEKQIPSFNSAQKQWTKDTFAALEAMEKNAIDCLNKVIMQYEDHTPEEQKKRYQKEYVKALYSLGTYYRKKPKFPWYEYSCHKLLKTNHQSNISYEDIQCIEAGTGILEKCFAAESGAPPKPDLDFEKMSSMHGKWAISPIDKLYQLGLAYLQMHFFCLTTDMVQEKIPGEYGIKAEAYLKASKDIGEQYRRMGVSNRSTWHINEKLARYYILNEDYSKAISLVERCRDSYIKNTYALALMLSDMDDRYKRAEMALDAAEADRYNKARDATIALKAYMYRLGGQGDKYKAIMEKKSTLNKSGKNLLSVLEQAGHYENR